MRRPPLVASAPVVAVGRSWDRSSRCPSSASPPSGDIYDGNLAEGKKLADDKVFSTKHYKELLDRKISTAAC